MVYHKKPPKAEREGQMRSLDKLIMLGRLILLYESLIAGLMFIAIAVAVLINPAMAMIAFELSCLLKIKTLVALVIPTDNLVALIMIASLLMGVANLAVAWASAYAKIRRKA